MSSDPTFGMTPEEAIAWRNGQHSAEVRHACIVAEATDLCWKATPYGETEDGDIAAYILPKGTVHRLVGALQGAGYPAALRNTAGQERQR